MIRVVNGLLTLAIATIELASCTTTTKPQGNSYPPLTRSNYKLSPAFLKSEELKRFNQPIEDYTLGEPDPELAKEGNQNRFSLSFDPP